MRRTPLQPKRGFAASRAQRLKVSNSPCVVCGRRRGDVRIDPAHVIDRSLGGGDDPMEVVALCAEHHRRYDEGELSLLEYLEPAYRAELAFAVGLHGLLRVLERTTNERWCPVQSRRAM